MNLPLWSIPIVWTALMLIAWGCEVYMRRREYQARRLGRMEALRWCRVPPSTSPEVTITSFKWSPLPMKEAPRVR